MPDIFDQYVHPKTEVKPIIYAYSDTRFPGCLKVGYTDRPIEVRMHEHYPTLTPGQSYKVELVESALNADGAIFMDHDVHRMLEAHGFHAQKSPDGKKSEWYKCSTDDVKAAILAVKTSSANLENRTQNFQMRPEQARAVRMTKEYLLVSRFFRKFISSASKYRHQMYGFSSSAGCSISILNRCSMSI